VTQGIIRKTNALKRTVEPFTAVAKELNELKELVALAESEHDSSLLAEIPAQLEKFAASFARFEDGMILSGKHDANNAYLSLHAGAGGTEACDWANMLFRMYSRWAESKKFDVEILDYQPGTEAGLKSATLKISGEYAYGFLKTEKGVHRLVRISPFDANKRRHTSFASVDVTAEIDMDIKVEIQEKDIRVDTYRSSGAGGQHVNKTDSAVRITHIPTNIIVQCQNQRSQHQNKETAMKMLAAKLLQLEEEKQLKEKEALEGQKKKIEWGSQIRSYVFHPYILVKDHRTGIETGNGDAVMDGDLDAFMTGYLKMFPGTD
jgi:peptide chain release factor 2